jgi:hypothetical protein
MTEIVNVDNFVRAETARMFDGILAQTPGINQWGHLRAPAPLDRQAVIRMNRDTLYSPAIVDISAGATVTLPDAGDRYLSMMAINEDHYINRVFYEPGTYRLTVEEFDTPYVHLAVRTFVDPDDPDDVAAVNALQDGLAIEAASANPYGHPDYDSSGLDATREALLKLAEGLPESRRFFGKEEEVDPVRHLIGTAAGWGGLPEKDAFYVIRSEPLPVGHYRITFADVPVDGFWSFTVYNRDGYFEQNEFGAYSLNNVTANRNDDGSVTIDLAPTADGFRNHLYVMDGWNYAIRFYRPRPDILDGRWTAPVPAPVA